MLQRVSPALLKVIFTALLQAIFIMAMGNEIEWCSYKQSIISQNSLGTDAPLCKVIINVTSSHFVWICNKLVCYYKYGSEPMSV